VFVLLVPAFWPVLLTNAWDQGLRFSLDKASYELLYLPLASAERGPIKNAIDIVVSRVADAVGAVILGIATRGFLMADGLGLGLRGTAAVNLVFIGAWLAIVLRLRAEYVRTIERSIHRHRLDAEHTGTGPLPASAAALRATLMSDDPAEVRNALDIIEVRGLQDVQLAVRDLLSHSEPDIRRRALGVLGAAQDRAIDGAAKAMLHDPDLGVRTAALLHVARVMGVDPLRELEALGDVEEFSIRAGMAAFLASPGPSQNLDAARVMLDAMARSEGPSGVRDRTEAAHVLALVPTSFVDLVKLLVQDEDAGVARQAMLAAGKAGDAELVTPLIALLARRVLAPDASRALAQYGDALVPELERRLHDPTVPLEIRRELPGVLVRIGTPLAQQALIEGLLQTDVTLRHRVLTSLNKLHDLHPEIAIDRQVIELVLAAEIAGHYRSYQLMGPLRAGMGEEDAVFHGLQLAMEQELERIFRLIGLLFRGASLHDAYVGVRSSNPGVRANALEFLDNVLDPDLRRLLVPLLDNQVSIEERIAAANRLVGAPFQTAEEAVETLLASPDPWLRNCGVYAVGALQIHSLEGELRRLTGAPDPFQGDAVEVALRRLAGAPDSSQPGAVPHGIEMGVG
jgi:AAA family ATP:ADP antiporter